MEKGGKVIHPELSYLLTGIFYEIHNEIGRFSREIQYGNLIEEKLKERKINFQREVRIDKSGNIVDFIIENKVLIELKVKQTINKEDYYQVQRYLQITDMKLGLLINFRDKYLKPKRIVRIETEISNKFK